MYNNIGGANQVDFSQFTQALQNGGSGSSTPAFSNQTFQPGSVVPAKRSHDGMSAGSPVPNQGSRSQTPSYGGGYPNQQGAGQQFANAPTPYSHLQQTNSNNATPSPTMSNQQFRPPTQQPRMNNASPSHFSQQQNNFGNQMSPGANQSANQPTSMPAFNPQYGMNSNPAMAGMPNAMGGQMNNAQTMNAQKAYQMKLMQHQQQLRNSGMIPPRPVGGAPVGSQPNQMFNAQRIANGQASGQANMLAQQQQQQAISRDQRNSFLKSIASHVQQQGRQFNPTPAINGKIVDLFALFHLATQLGGSANVDRSGQWQTIATRMGFNQNQFPNAAEELRQLHANNIAQYERFYIAASLQAKQDKARRQAQEMAGVAGGMQGSPTRTAQTPTQQAQYSQYQQNQQGQPQPEPTPVQANAQLPQNGMATPQQQQMLQHRRASSVRRPEQMTPQAGGQSLTAQSPMSAGKASQRSPPDKQENQRMKFEEPGPRETEFTPQRQRTEWYGGYDVENLYALGRDIAENRPVAPTVDEMGVMNIKAISLSLASGLHREVRYALDALAQITNDPRILFDLRKCEDLPEIIIDCAEDQTDLLSEEAAEVSDALDLSSYEEILRASRMEEQTLQEVPEYGTQAYELDRAAEKLIAVTTILRNLSFYGENHQALTSANLIKWLSNTIRLLGTRNMLLRTFFNTQDFYKDMITFLSNVAETLELPSRDDALHILHFLLAFAPQPAPSYTESGGKIRFMNYIPNIHIYLPPAVDTLAKLLARQDPNRMLYKNIFTASSFSLAISESPLDLLTRAFALSISVLPDRSKSKGPHTHLKRIAEARKPFLWQGMLAADILSSLAPGNNPDLARAWIESEDGWTVGLLNLASILSVDTNPQNPQQKTQQLREDSDHLRIIAQRALTMMKRLAEKAGRGQGAHAVTNGMVNGNVNGDVADDVDDVARRWEGIPQGHTVLGALTMPNSDKVVLGLLCGLHDMAMQT